MARPTLLDDLVDLHAPRTIGESLRIAIEQIAGEIAKETLQDETFRPTLKATIQRAANQIIADLEHPQPDRRRPEPAGPDAPR
jgi:hypothetical protein